MFDVARRIPGCNVVVVMWSAGVFDVVRRIPGCNVKVMMWCFGDVRRKPVCIEGRMVNELHVLGFLSNILVKSIFHKRKLANKHL